MSYLYGSRFKAKETDLILSLRQVESRTTFSATSAEPALSGTVYPGLRFH